MKKVFAIVAVVSMGVLPAFAACPCSSQPSNNQNAQEQEKKSETTDTTKKAEMKFVSDCCTKDSGSSEETFVDDSCPPCNKAEKSEKKAAPKIAFA